MDGCADDPDCFEVTADDDFFPAGADETEDFVEVVDLADRVEPGDSLLALDAELVSLTDAEAGWDCVDEIPSPESPPLLLEAAGVADVEAEAAVEAAVVAVEAEADLAADLGVGLAYSGTCLDVSEAATEAEES